ncbi:MAG: RnfABCDGE type electron transport complex subunit D [Firmicutes bacterium]|nr:RnfABCDGE type electron transport complex subunit D [Bacillota bacterium]
MNSILSRTVRKNRKPGGLTTSQTMREVIFALVPIVIFASIYFGAHVLLVCFLSMATAVLSELFWSLVTQKTAKVSDFSSAVTGLMCALVMPASAAWYIPVFSSCFAVIVMKLFFGGFGKNILNPALASRALMMFVFAISMREFSVDAITIATPLVHIEQGEFAMVPGYLSMFLGVIPGCIGETSKLLILLSGIYLSIRGVIDFRIPVSMLVFAFLTALVLQGPSGALYQLLSGGLFFAAVFAATDPVTSAKGPVLSWIYGALCGMLVILFRMYLPLFTGGVTPAVLLMNLLFALIQRGIPYLKKKTAPRDLPASEETVDIERPE